MTNEATIKQISDLSDAAWEQAADEPRDEDTAAEFIADWDACGDAYMEARRAIDGGDATGARQALERAGALEAKWGSREHADRALATL